MSDLVAAARLDSESQRQLDEAVRVLEGGRGLVLRLADLLGHTLGRLGHGGLSALRLAGAGGAVAGVAEAALERAYDIAILGMDGPASGGPRMARGAVVFSGALGGMLGPAGFLPDAAVTTLAIMREVARIAREEGEDVVNGDTRRACLEVFGLSGDGGNYWETRFVLGTGPTVRVLAAAAARYGVALGEKLSVQVVPVIGAVSAAALNAAFLDHYTRLARAHFTVRRLERVYGAEEIRRAAPALASANRKADEPFLDA